MSKFVMRFCIIFLSCVVSACSTEDISRFTALSHEERAEKIWNAISSYVQQTGEPPSNLERLVSEGFLEERDIFLSDGRQFSVLVFFENLTPISSHRSKFYYLYAVAHNPRYVFYRKSFEFPWEGALEKQIKVEGYAENDERGAKLIVEPDGILWLEGLNEWDASHLGNNVLISGKVIESNDLPLLEPVEVELFEGLSSIKTHEDRLKIIDWEIRGLIP